MANSKKLEIKSKKSEVKAKSSVKASANAQKLRAAVKKTGELSLDLFDIKGKTAGKIDLPKEIFGAKINNQLLAQAVRVYLANQRKGTAETKTRGEVHGSTRKIWRQKGTGRARHGSKKAPIFVHGGIAFGPHPRDFSLKISKKMKRQALFSALSSKLKSNEIKAVTGLEKLDPKTKSMADVINNLGIDKKKRNILMITPLKNDLENVYRAARNLEGVRILNANVLNTYDVLNNRLILLMDKAVDSIKENFANAKIN
ncbi:MAG: hypothetical protein ACD_50C00352G0006 [uncultured bacterium]|nr:MAG: hypothetical protein ACD_50C00352G0006 [uncultured bacterium]